MSYVGDNNHYDHDDDDGDCKTWYGGIEKLRRWKKFGRKFCVRQFRFEANARLVKMAFGSVSNTKS